MKCLVVRFSSLGDIILTTPVVETLAAGAPDCAIHYATHARYLPVIGHFPCPVIVHAFTGRARGDFDAYAHELADTRFDIVFDLHANRHSRSLVRRLRGTPVHTYPKDFWRRWSLVCFKRGFAGARSVVDRYLETVRRAGFPAGETNPRLRIDARERAAVVRELTGLGWSADCPTVAIGWGARWPTKKAPARLWDDLVARLNTRGTPVYIVLAPTADEPEVAEFTARHKEATIVPYCGRTFPEALGALSLCDVAVSSDSGLMHAAAALGVPTLGIFGPTHPALGFAPRGAGSLAVHSGVFCSPCSRHGRTPCYRRRRHCFDRIDLESLVEQIIARWKGND